MTTGLTKGGTMFCVVDDVIGAATEGSVAVLLGTEIVTVKLKYTN